MKKLYFILSSITIATIFAACSGDSNSSTVNVILESTENKNTVAEENTDFEENTEVSLTASDWIYINNLLQSYGPAVYIDASDMSPNEEDFFPSLYDSVTVLPVTPVEYNFHSKNERIYEHLNTMGKSCWIDKYILENGAQRIEIDNVTYSWKTLFLRENEESRFSHYLLNNEYGINSNPKVDCPTDSIDFAKECKNINGILASYSEGCSVRSTPNLALICIAKINKSITLEDLVIPFKRECESYIASSKNNLQEPKSKMIF